MARRDYYEVLGVARDATDDQIRRAYRDLARRLHPDVNKAPDAQAKFTEIQEAYDVLSDEKKRRLYDQTGRVGAQPHVSWSNVAGEHGDADFDLEDLGSVFDAFFAGRSGRPGPRSASPFGHRASAKRRPARVLEHEVLVPFIRAAMGGTHRVSLDVGGKKKSIEVTVPSATRDGARLRVRGVGPSGEDLILTVRVGEHPVFRRCASGDLDVELDLPVTIAEATVGASIRIPTLEGLVDVRLPPGTASGKRLRLRGRGLTDAKGREGDLYAVVRIVPPAVDRLSDAERSMLEQVSHNQDPPREGEMWREGWTP
ncbi:MAG: DnaJ domain-containing protein [Phycisphaeraceae bacterium]|nr:DnaJ domain-containing protein [Phycisphaeraceae bacterium]